MKTEDSTSLPENRPDKDGALQISVLSEDGQLAPLVTVEAQAALSLAVLRYLRRIKRDLSAARVQTGKQTRIDSSLHGPTIMPDGIISAVIGIFPL